MAKLRTLLDGNDGFMRGHGTVKARTYKRVVPEWAMNNARVQALVLRAFPNAASDSSQRERAARWASVIHLYFRMGYTRSQIAEELGSTTLKIHGVIRSILRVSKGLRSDGGGALGVNPRGRPKKTAPKHL